MRNGLLFLVLILGWMGCQAPCESPMFSTRGEVVQILFDGQAATIRHEQIPGLMEPMQMTFKTAEGTSLRNITAGDKLAFDLRITADGFLLDNLERLPAETVLELPEPALAAQAPVAATPRSEPPSGSPLGSAKTYVGNTYLRVMYGRPYKRGRIIFGGLVAFDRIWATGAHTATEIIMTEPMNVGGTRLNAGVYAIFTRPGRTQWHIHFNTHLGMHMSDEYDPTEDILVLDVPVESLNEIVDQHTIRFEPAAGGTDLIIEWDQTRVRVPFRSL